jgi:hypothetical protein
MDVGKEVTVKTASIVSVASWIVAASLSAGCGDDGTAGTTGGNPAGTGTSSASTGGAGGGGTGGSGMGGTGTGGVGGMPGTGGAGGMVSSGGAGGGGSLMNFFVTSDTRPDGIFGGLQGADDRCQTLAGAVGEGSKTWRAYLSIENPATNARDRIGSGPYYNAAGVEVAADKDALHMIDGHADLFLDENGQKINGQWPQSPGPNEHDIMTGTTADGMLDAGATCGDWTMNAGSVRVGHSDGLGPGGSNMPPYNSWNSSHDGSCSNPAQTGGAGKIYCFVGP